MRLFLFLLFWTSAVVANAQDVRISEFLASNGNGLRDEDGAASPWIEVWNPSATAKVSLGGWKLKYGEVEWVFPVVEILPDQHLIIWASSKNKRVVTAPLHTNFTLGTEGSYLALLRPTGTIASEFAPTYPPQNINVSFGRDAVSSALTGYYAAPTPGDANSYSGAGVAPKPVFSVKSKAYTSSFQLSLSLPASDPTAVIRYTINGSVPRYVATIDETTTTGSHLYTGPITITTASSQIIRARVFKAGLLPGETETEAFLLLDPASANFSSSTPLIALSNFGRGTPPEDGDQPAFMWVFQPGPSGVTRLTDAPVLASRIVMDRRGSSTLTNPKFNLNVESRKARDEQDRNIPLLGMPDHSDWVFHAPYDYDRSLVHNPFIYALSNQIGRYAPRNKMAEVFVDVDGGSLTVNTNYFGVYNIMEKIRRGTERVKISKLETNDNGPVEKTGGFIVKVDRKDPGDVGFGTPRQASFAYYQPRENEALTPQRDPQEQYIKTFLTSFDNSMYNFALSDQVNGYRKYLDVPAAIDHHLLNLWPMNVDALRLSGYMYKDRDRVINGTQVISKLVYGPVWDFDRAMESTDARDDIPGAWRGTGDATDFFNYSWWTRLFTDIEFYQAYIDQWQNLRRGPFSRENVEALLDELNAEIGDAAANRDMNRWGRTKRAWTSPFTGVTYTGQRAEIQRIKDWMQQRANFIDTQWVGPVTLSPANGNVAPGSTVTMTGPVGVPIYYTTDGSDPRPLGGSAPTTTAIQYTGPVTVSATTRIRARAYKINHTAQTGPNNPPLISRWSGVTEARFAVETPAATGALLITEINYHPANPTAQELAADPNFADSDFEFLEVKNVSAVPIDLGEATFTTGIRFTFTGPNAISLQPGEIAIVAANPDAFAVRYGAKPNVVGPFQGDLSNAGESLVLMSATGQTLLSFTYDDAWYPSTDGAGGTLVVYDQGAPTTGYSTAGFFRPSPVVGGTPGADDPPIVTTFAASAVTATSVQLSAEVSPNGLATTMEFVVSGVRHPAANVPVNSPPVIVELTLTDLSPRTTYTYRAEGTNSLGTGAGAEMTFTTLNRAPVTEDQTLHIVSRTPFEIGVLASDADGDELTITSITQGATGELTTDGKKLFYAPAAEYDGNAVFSYVVSDGFGGTASATITLHNAVPTGGADNIVSHGEAVTFDPFANDSDADADPLSLFAVTQGTVGAVTFGEGSITYTPGPGFIGQDQFTYTFSDGSALVSVNVSVGISSPLALVGAMVGTQVPGQPAGTVYSKLGLPTSGISLGKVRSGAGVQSAIFAGDGSVLLKVGDVAPGIPGALISSLQEPSGQAVVAKLRGAVAKGNDTVLYVDLDKGQPRVGAREGAAMVGGGTLKNFSAIDGNGPSVFFLATLGGVEKSKNVALGVVLAGADARLLLRKGDLIEGEPIRGIGTLVGVRGTLAARRWRMGPDTIGVRLSFRAKAEALYEIPAAETLSPVRWGKTGDLLPESLTVQSFGIPGFAPDGFAAAARVKPGGASDVALIRATSGGSTILAKTRSPVPGATGDPLPSMTFRKFGSPIAGADGSTAFSATITGPGVRSAAGIWYTENGSPLRLIARAGEAAPGGGQWKSFDSLVLSDGPNRAPIFTATLAPTGKGAAKQKNRALYGVDSLGQLRLLLAPGQSLDTAVGTREVASLRALESARGSIGAARGFSDDGRVVALVTFTDKTQALVYVSLP